MISAVVIHGEWFSSINRHIIRSHHLWPDSQTSQTAASVLQPHKLTHLRFYNSSLTLFLWMFLTHLHPDTPVCRSILAEPGQWCTDHCKETGRTQRQGRWLNLNQIWLTEWKSYLVLALWHSTPASWLHTPVLVGEIHAQQDALLLVAQGGDNNQIPDSGWVDRLQLNRLAESNKRMWETERRSRSKMNVLYTLFLLKSEVTH